MKSGMNKTRLGKLAFLGIVFPLLIFAFSLAACSGGSAGEETAIISISLSVGSPADETPAKAAVSLDQLRHVIRLSGPAETQSYTIAGSGTVNASVQPGLWYIDVKGYLEDELYSVGSASADVKARKTTNVSIEMTVVWSESGSKSGGGGGGGGSGVIAAKAPNFIEFLDNQATITKVYGTPLFTNGINPAHKGSGAITYSSSDPSVAAVDATTGEVAILKTGSTNIIAKKAADGVYAGTQTQYELVVTKALLTVTADNEILAVFDPVPAYTYTPSGFAYSDTQSALTGAPAFSCSYTSTSPKGSYPITITRGTLDSENYDFSFVDGSVSVGLANQATLTIVKPSTITYGDLDFILSTTGGSGTGVTVNFTLVSGSAISLSGTNNESVSIQSAGTATVKATKAGDSDYNPVEEIVTITVNKRDLSNATVTVGGAAEYTGSPQEAGSPLSLDVEDFVSLVNIITASDYDVSYSSNTYPGTATLTITATSGGNYTGAPQTANFTIDQKQLGIASASHTKEYDTYDTATGVTVTFSGVNGSDVVSAGSITAEYTSADAGTKTITITALSLGGAHQAYYAVTPPFSVTVSGGITQAAGATLSTPTQSGTLTSSSLAVSALTASTGQDVNYAISTSSTETLASLTSPTNKWGTSPSFTSLTPNTLYYVYAYAPTNTNYKDGNVVRSGAITTLDAYTVSFNGNSPTGGTGPASQNVDAGSSITTFPSANTLYKTGYSFGGWSTTTTGSALSSPYTPPNSITLYAVWTPITYTITYNANIVGNSGSVPGNQTGISYGSSVTIGSNTLGTRTGFTFTEWNTAANGGGASYLAGSSASNLSSTNGATVTLYAQWLPSYNLGDTGPGTGRIFYARPSYDGFILEDINPANNTTCYYLEAAPNDETTQLATNILLPPEFTFADTAIEIGKGKLNSQMMVDDAGAPNTPTANACLSATYGGQSWFLPARNEILELWKCVDDGTINSAGFQTTSTYATSTIYTNGCFYVLDFLTGTFNGIANQTTPPRWVRAIRAF